MKRLWALPRGRVYALPSGDARASRGGGAGTCFNGGFLLLEPDDGKADLMERAFYDARVLKLKHCPGHDQRLLNSVFPQWGDLQDTWRMQFAGLAEGKLRDADAVHIHHKSTSPFLYDHWKKVILPAMRPDIRRACGDVLTAPGANWTGAAKLSTSPGGRRDDACLNC